MRVVFGELFQPDGVQGLPRDSEGVLPVGIGVELQGQAHIAHGGAPWEQGGVLRDEADALAALQLGRLHAAQLDTAGCRRGQAADGAQQSSLAASTRPYERYELGRRYLKDSHRAALSRLPVSES